MIVIWKAENLLVPEFGGMWQEIQDLWSRGGCGGVVASGQD